MEIKVLKRNKKYTTSVPFQKEVENIFYEVLAENPDKLKGVTVYQMREVIRAPYRLFKMMLSTLKDTVLDESTFTQFKSVRIAYFFRLELKQKFIDKYSK